MSDTAVDTSAEISAKDLKEKKEVVEETENGRDAPANGNAVRKRTVMKTTKLREPQANGQLRTTRTTTSIPRSRKPMKMTRQQIIIIFFLNKEENKPTKKASASSSPLGPPFPPVATSSPHTHLPFLPPPPWSSSPSRVNPVPGPPARRCHSTNVQNDSPVSGERNPPFSHRSPPPQAPKLQGPAFFLKSTLKENLFVFFIYILYFCTYC